jgi:hypothetical protein
MKKIIMILAATICFSFCVNAQGNTPFGVIKKYHDCIKAKQYEASVNCFEAAAFARVSKQTFVSITKTSYEALKGLKSYEILSEDINESGYSGTVTVKVTYGDNRQQKIKYYLAKSGNEWKISEAKQI